MVEGEEARRRMGRHEGLREEERGRADEELGRGEEQPAEASCAGTKEGQSARAGRSVGCLPSAVDQECHPGLLRQIGLTSAARGMGAAGIPYEVGLADGLAASSQHKTNGYRT